MFEDCLIYFDNITSFHPSQRWTDISKNAPFIYFTPDAVQNVSLSSDSNSNLVLSWNNGLYYPNPQYEHPDNIEYLIEIFNVNSNNEVGDLERQIGPFYDSSRNIGTLTAGNYKIVIKTRSFVNYTHSPEPMFKSDYSDDMEMLVTLDSSSGIVQTTSLTNFIHKFTDDLTTVDYEWNYKISIVTTNGNSEENLVETFIQDSNGNKFDDAFGLSIDFATGSSLSYVEFKNNAINLVSADSFTSTQNVKKC